MQRTTIQCDLCRAAIPVDYLGWEHVVGQTVWGDELYLLLGNGSPIDQCEDCARQIQQTIKRLDTSQEGAA